MARSDVGIGVLLGLVFGAAAGALSMHFLGSEEAAASESEALREFLAETAPPGESATLSEPEERAPVSEPEAASERESVDVAEPGAIMNPALLEHAREGIARGWSREHQTRLRTGMLAEGMRRFEELVMSSPESIGRDLGVAMNKGEEILRDAATGGLFALLEGLESGEAGPMTDVVRDRTKFEKYFTRDSSEEIAVSGIGLTRDHFTEMVDGTTLTFPTGVYSIETLSRYWREIPRDITIRGAGKDSTLIVLDELSSMKQVKNFRLENCTVFCNGSVFDLRRGPASAVFSNVRITGFDTGAGGSNAIFAKEGMALHYVNCDIVGGYGRHPDGRLLRTISPAFLARFDKCRFERLNLGLDRLEAGGTVVFSLCSFSELLDWTDQEAAAEASPGIVLDQCSFDTKIVDPRQRPPVDELRRDLNDLFPDWEAEIGR
jgi:hypothetical protein